SSRLVQLMRGRIWVESNPQQPGSRFHFTVRLGLQQGAVPRQVPLEAGGLLGLEGVVGDDNATNRRVATERLARWGMRPMAAQAGAEALRRLGEKQAAGEEVPLILLDAMMPEMDGFEVAARIQQHPELARATVMMLSSAGSTGGIARCRSLGISSFLTKPV